MTPRHRAERGSPAARIATAIVTVPAIASTFATGQITAVAATEIPHQGDDSPTSISLPAADSTPVTTAEEIEFMRDARPHSAAATRETIAKEIEARAVAEAVRMAEEQRLAEEERQRQEAAERAEQSARDRQAAEREAQHTADLDDDEIAQVEREEAEPENAPEAEPRASSRPDAGIASGIIGSAKKYLGLAYVWGGTTPAGFDCSGLTQYVYKKHGVSLKRVANDQATQGTRVSKAEAAPGDLVFFRNSSGRAYHVGIYLGDGQMLHSPKRGDVVKISAVWSSSAEYRRVL